MGGNFGNSFGGTFKGGKSIYGSTTPDYKGGQMASMTYSPGNTAFNKRWGIEQSMQDRAIKQAQKYDVPLYGKGGNIIWSPQGWQNPAQTQSQPAPTMQAQPQTPQQGFWDYLGQNLAGSQLAQKGGQ